MARGKLNVRKRNIRTKKSFPKRMKRRQRKRGTRANNHSSSGSLGTMVHRGLRSILSLLPGATIVKDVADLVFKSLSNGVEIAPGVMDGKVYALHTAFYLTPACLLGDTVAGSTLVASTVNPEARVLITNYDNFRVSHFKLSARNMSIEAKGIWAIGFWPFVSEDDQTKLVRDVYYLSDIRLAPNYVEGPAAEPLTLRHYFTPSEKVASLPGDSSNKHGIIAIAYTDISRTTYGRITADAFKPQLELSGSVIMSSRLSNSFNKITNVVTALETADSIISSNGVFTSSGPVQYHDHGTHVRMVGKFDFNPKEEETICAMA